MELGGGGSFARLVSRSCGYIVGHQGRTNGSRKTKGYRVKRNNVQGIDEWGVNVGIKDSKM
jgi:hypothetical protein